MSAQNADADPTPSITTFLVDPVQLGKWLHDHDSLVESSYARLDAAVAAGRQARVYPNPTLDVGLGGIPIGRGNFSAGVFGPTSLTSVANITLGVSELIEIGKRAPRASAADVRVRAASERTVAMLGDRISTATSKLGRLAYLAAKRDTMFANLEAAKRLRDLEKIRVDNKDLSAVEFARIELDTEELAIQLARAEAELAGAVSACGATLHAPCSSAGLVPHVLDTAAALPSTVQPDAAIEKRPIRNASKLEAQGLRWDATLASARRLPDVTVGVDYTYDNYEYSGSIPQTIGFSLSIPIPFLDRGSHDAASARATAHATEAEDQAAVLEAHGTVAALLTQRDTLQGILSQLETSAVPKSTQIIAQTQKAFDLGQARLADLLLVERAHRDLLLEVLDTRFDLFNVRAQLRQELGLDDEVGRSIAGSRR